MKATKKIVGAAVALVAAVALSAGSTFAWFTAGGSVQASGMQVKATVPSSLLVGYGVDSTTSATSGSTTTTDNLIKSTYTNGNVSSAASSKTNLVYSNTAVAMGDTKASSLAPVDIVYASEANSTSGVQAGLNFYKDGKGNSATDANVDDEGELVKWTKTENNDTNAYASAIAPNNTNTSSNYDDAAYTALSGNAAFYNMCLYLPGDSSAKAEEDVNATVTLTTNSSAGVGQLKFLHVGFLTAKATDSSEASSLTWTSTFKSYYQYATTEVSGNSVEYSVSNVISKMNYASAYNVLVVVFFEGRDVDCYSNNAINTADLNVAITFETEASSETASDYIDYTVGGSTYGYKASDSKFYKKNSGSYEGNDTEVTKTKVGSTYVFSFDSGSTWYTLTNTTFAESDG